MWVSLIESLSKMHLPPLSKQEFCQQTTFGLKWHLFLGFQVTYGPTLQILDLLSQYC